MPISINGTTGISGVDGSAGTPALQGSDTNTGIAFGSDVILGSTGGTERFRCDSSGRLLVGTSTAFNSGYTDPLKSIIASSTYASGLGLGLYHFQNDSNAAFLNIGKSDNNTIGSHTAVGASKTLGGIFFDGSDGSAFKNGASIIATNDQASSWASGDCPTRLTFSVTADGASSPTEAMSINNAGSILINTGIGAPGGASVTGRAAITFNPSTHGGLVIASGSGAGTLQQFTNTAFGVVGSITTNGTATAFNTSSDYRLKENVVDLSNALDRLRQIPVRRFNFIADPDNTVDGFLAHEVQDVVPEAITGEKDAVDDDGNAVYQGIDQSKLVPLLTAALQEAVAKIESLEARLTAAGI